MGTEVYRGDAPGCIDGAPYEFALGEAARTGNTDGVRYQLEHGTPIDFQDYRGETALILAARWGQLATAKLLIERGANVNVVCCLGTALAALQPGYHKDAVAIAEALFAAGASPHATADYTESAIDQWLRSDRKLEKKVVAPLGKILQLALPHAGDRAPDIQARLKRLGISEAAAKKSADKAAASGAKLLAAAAKPGWDKKVKTMLGPLDKPKTRASTEAAAKLLAAPEAVANKAWPALVTALLDLSWSYGDITEKVGGKRRPVSKMGDDESGAMDYYGDDHLYTFDWVLQILATPAAIAHPKWADLVLATCKAKQTAIGDYSAGDDEIAALLAVPEAKAHAKYKAIVAAAKKAFPYASCFGANGFLRGS